MPAEGAGVAARGAPIAKGGLAGWQSRRIRELAASELRILSVRHLAAAVELSPHHFSRAFRVSFGCSPRDWILKVKMDAAEGRLLGTSDTVERIAMDLGYKSGSQFSRIFRARFGTSPQAFRRR